MSQQSLTTSNHQIQVYTQVKKYVRNMRGETGPLNATAAAPVVVEKPVMVIGIDESEHSCYALEWMLDQFFAPFSADKYPFKLLIVHSKPMAAYTATLAGLEGVDILVPVEDNLQRVSARVAQKAREICERKSITDMDLQVMEGDPRNVLCEAVEKYHAFMLVLGNRGHGTITRAGLGSVSDYCTHHAPCSVLIVKEPEIKHQMFPSTNSNKDAIPYLLGGQLFSSGCDVLNLETD